MEIGGEIIESKEEKEGDRTGYNVDTKEMVQKNISTAWRRSKYKNKCTSRTWT